MDEMDEFAKLVLKMNKCVKVTNIDIDTFIKDHDHINYCEAIIAKDGKIGYAVPCHINSLVGELGLTLDEAYKAMPIHEMPLRWLINKTGAIAVWYDFFTAPSISSVTKEQYNSLLKLAKTDIVKWDRNYIERNIIGSQAIPIGIEAYYTVNGYSDSIILKYEETGDNDEYNIIKLACDEIEKRGANRIDKIDIIYRTNNDCV